jgi:hypothetical protein
MFVYADERQPKRDLLGTFLASYFAIGLGLLVQSSGTSTFTQGQLGFDIGPHPVLAHFQECSGTTCADSLQQHIKQRS